jgi:hypothetical protein
MRFLPIFLLIAGCANDPVTLYDGLGEVPTEGPITMGQIDFTEQGVSLDRIEDCFDLEEIEVGVLCNADTAKVELDSEQWTIDEVDTSMAQYNVDEYREGDVVCYENGVCIRWIIERGTYEELPNSRWAECGCPSGCSDADCRWEQSEENNKYLCEGGCRGSHCSECSVELVTTQSDAPPAE